MDLKVLIEEIKKEIDNFDTKLSHEDYRKKFISNDGAIRQLFSKMKEVPPELKKESGLLLNEIKQFAEHKYESLKRIIIEPYKQTSINKPKEIIKEIIYNKVISKPKFNTGDYVWSMISNKAIRCKISTIRTEETIREFLIFYDCYFSNIDLGVINNGSPTMISITRLENQIFNTKEELLSKI